ncbi:hypothetical protein ACFSMW_12080 [Virgibacillus halophilus]|uniref:Lipoprotein n=1 Tax=Tigheibacillus halophilus TaxID=361280 RepID=A0ABU5C713_9BACI|nr:hypothetical protein [Virgibacillus halophilus]
MKKTIALLGLCIILLAGCGGNSDSEAKGNNVKGIDDIDKEKAKNSIIQGALDSNLLTNTAKEDYSKSDIVNIKMCEAYHIDHPTDGFEGNFIVFWETSDGKYEHNFIMKNDYEIENLANYERLDDKCVNLD